MIKEILKIFAHRLYLMGKTIDQQRMYDSYRVTYCLSKRFRFNGPDILFYGGGQIIIQDDSYIGTSSTIQAYEGCKVLIGAGCKISHNVRVYTQSYVADQNFADPVLLERHGDVSIGDNVWIGANVLINPGVTVGSNSVIGANSVVSKNVEPFSIVGGVPAKLIRFKACRVV